jgi:hypothetical protein
MSNISTRTTVSFEFNEEDFIIPEHLLYNQGLYNSVTLEMVNQDINHPEAKLIYELPDKWSFTGGYLQRGYPVFTFDVKALGQVRYAQEVNKILVTIMKEWISQNS